MNSLVINETIREAMLLVRRMSLAAGHLPYGRVNFGEEGIGLCRCIVNVGDAELVGYRQGFLIDTRPSDDVNFLIGTAGREGSFQRVETLGTRELDVLTRKHDVAAVGQGTFRQRLEGLATHDDGMAGGQCLEAFQVIG